MAVAIPSKLDINNDDITIGHATLVSVYKRGKLHWALPGGGYTKSRPFAMTYAMKLNRMIQNNMDRFGSNLLWL